MMKQEPTESPSSTALASRIAQYSYEATPSPNGKRTPTPVKREPGPSVSPHFTRNRASVLSPGAVVVRSPHFSKPPTPVTSVGHRRTLNGTRAVSNDGLDSDDDLESIEGSTSDNRAGVDWGDDGEVEYESDGLGDLISSDSDEEETTTPSRQSQTRIRARRAGRTEQYLIQEGESSTGARKRRKIKREGSDHEGTRTKKKKIPRGYAAPEIYQHLRPLPDILAPGLNVVFCGINPGVRSSTTGHHFGHPTNKFWRSLHQSGMTSRLIKPEEDHLLPTEFNFGLTVLVDRPTAEQSELSTHEMRLNVLPFTEKLMGIKPGVVCFVGKKIWDVYESVVSKSARVVDTGQAVNVKEAQDDTTTLSDPPPAEEGQGGDVKPTMIDNPTSGPAPTPRRRTPAKVKETFDWTKPRPFRLPHPTDDGLKYTYFWVVPNTSGLERTPLAEQVVLFRHLKAFNEEIKAGRVEGVFRDIDIEGVKETVEAMTRAAEARNVKQE